MFCTTVQNWHQQNISGEHSPFVGNVGLSVNHNYCWISHRILVNDFPCEYSRLGNVSLSLYCTPAAAFIWQQKTNLASLCKIFNAINIISNMCNKCIWTITICSWIYSINCLRTICAREFWQNRRGKNCKNGLHNFLPSPTRPKTLHNDDSE